MKTTVKFIFRSMLVLTAVAVVVTGCRKKKEEDNDTGSASDNAFAEASYNDMSTIGDQASTGTMSTFRNGNDEGSLLSA
ncbi:MAG TPA: hypothetical protein VI112_02050, partial [Bacteroidia bacterium]